MTHKPRRIVGVAVYDDLGHLHMLPKPYRHPDVLLNINALGRRYSGEQGFVLSDGSFVSRTEAKRIAKQSGQLIADTDLAELYSEDLW